MLECCRMYKILLEVILCIAFDLIRKNCCRRFWKLGMEKWSLVKEVRSVYCSDPGRSGPDDDGTSYEI
jgi:hypothetical protein